MTDANSSTSAHTRDPSADMPRLMTLDEAAKATRVSRRTIQRWLGDGLLSAYRLAGDRRRHVDPSEIRPLRRSPVKVREGSLFEPVEGQRAAELLPPPEGSGDWRRQP